jgi:hypothetical protein
MFQGSLLQIGGRFVAILLGLLFVINGIFMLVSPRAYFKLPGWLAPKGGHITEKNMAAAGARWSFGFVEQRFSELLHGLFTMRS